MYVDKKISFVKDNQVIGPLAAAKGKKTPRPNVDGGDDGLANAHVAQAIVRRI